MVIPDNVFHRIRKINSFQNVATYRRMNLHFRKFSFSELAGFVEDVLGHGQLADVVQQRAGEERSQFLVAYFQELTHLTRVNLSSAHVTVSRLVFSVDGNRQRLDGVHVQIGNLFHVTKLLGLRAHDFFHPLFVETIQQVHQTHDKNTHEEEWNTAVMNRGVEQGRGRNVGHLRHQSPNQTFL